MGSNKFIIPFGIHEGEYLNDLPTSYLEHIENTIEDEKIKSFLNFLNLTVYSILPTLIFFGISILIHY